MAAALAVPPLADGSSERRPTNCALVLSAGGRDALQNSLTRSPTARALFAQLAALPDGLSVAEIATLPAHRRRILREWRERDFVVPVQVRIAGPDAAVVTLNDDQRAAVADIASASGDVHALRVVRRHRQRQDGRLPRSRGAHDQGRWPGIAAGTGNQPHAAIGTARAPGAAGVSVALLNSGLADGARREHWRAATAGEARLVLGTRLGVFAPMPSLSLIVVDEEHDASYKQQDNVRYHARDVAVWRAHRRHVPIVLGSATPSLETWLHATEGRYRRLDLPASRRSARANAGGAVRGQPAGTRARGHWRAVARSACGVPCPRRAVAVVRQSPWLAPSLLCSSCGWEANCSRCTARLTVHRTPAALRCHHCGHEGRLPHACPDCGNVDLLPLGFGTQRLERVVAEAFPSARIARIDRDSTRARGAFAAMREQVAANELDILIGTQMLAKGHDFPRLTLVGVLGADNALYSADFRATERLAALLMQVAGRAGRAGLPGRSHHPD